MDKFSDPEIGNLLKDADNQICFDCGDYNPKWASVNNSVFVCLACAGVHRGLGVNYSFIRSLTMDNWDQKQIKLLSIGGNKRLMMILQEFGIPKDVVIESKYKLKVLDYYRKLLRAEAFDEEMPIKPDMISAFEQIDLDYKVIDLNQQSNESDLVNQPNINEITNKIDEEQPKDNTGFFSKIGMFFDKGINDIQKGIDNMNLKDKANNIGKKAIDFKSDVNDIGKKTVNYAEEKSKIVVNSIQSMFKKTTAFLGIKTSDNSNVDPQENNSSKEENTKVGLDTPDNINIQQPEGDNVPLVDIPTKEEKESTSQSLDDLHIQDQI